VRMDNTPPELDSYERAAGQLLRDWRVYLGHSQAWLAAQVGFSLRVIQRVELGHRKLTVGELGMICNALKIPPEGIVPNAWGPRPNIDLVKGRAVVKPARSSTEGTGPEPAGPPDEKAEPEQAVAMAS